MILGVGTDIIEIDRIKRAMDNTSGFLERIFTDKEIKYLSENSNRIESIAGNFAVKEAVSKALGTGIRGFTFSGAHSTMMGAKRLSAVALWPPVF